MAAHNRVDITGMALDALKRQGVQGIVHLFFVDDGSVDGTCEMACAVFGDEITVIRGPGDWFWARSMEAAETVMASEGSFDYVLWLNDDTFLVPDAIERLIRVSVEKGDLAAVVGVTINSISGELMYGGLKVLGPGVLRQRPLEVRPWHQPVDTFHGNVVLIPRAVHDAVGRIDGNFEHAYADTDYGLRISKTGFSSFQCAGICAMGTFNEASMEVYKPTWKVISHLRKNVERKALPVRSTKRFLKRHTGGRWPLYFAYVYIRTLFPVVSRSPRSHLFQ